MIEPDPKSFREALSGKIKFTVSIGKEKVRKMTGISRKLPGSGIIITPEPEITQYAAEFLDSAGIKCSACHLDLPPEESLVELENFRSGNTKILVADASYVQNISGIRVKFIIHWSLPLSIINYLQTTCELTNPESESFAVLLYEPGDRYHAEARLKNIYGSDREKLRESLKLLDEIENYAATDRCRVSYMRDVISLTDDIDTCGVCDNCKTKIASSALSPDEQNLAKILLKCAAETREKFGFNVLTDILRGGKSGRITEYKLNRASTFGAIKNTRRMEIISLFRKLIKNNYLNRTKGTFPSLYLSPLGKQLLGKTPVRTLELPKKMSVRPGETIDIALQEKVRNFRREKARELNIPAFTLFSDIVLKEIIKTGPDNMKDLRKLRGFGETTWELCGEGLLSVIRAHIDNDN